MVAIHHDYSVIVLGLENDFLYLKKGAFKIYINVLLVFPDSVHIIIKNMK